jgi:hypothetical protein
MDYGTCFVTGALRVFEGPFFLRRKAMTTPMITPERRERNMMMARDALNFQKRKETSVGTAFWTEKMVTKVMIMNMSIMENIP